MVFSHTNNEQIHKACQILKKKYRQAQCQDHFIKTQKRVYLSRLESVV